jgi:hypothetical protein
VKARLSELRSSNASGSMTRHKRACESGPTRENAFTVTATSQKLAALVAAARMALEAMRGAPEPPPAGAVAVPGRSEFASFAPLIVAGEATAR